MLPASWMLTATSYLGDTGVFRILAVLATVLAIAFSHTQASPMCALFIVCHTLPPLLSRFVFFAFTEFNARTAALAGQARYGAVRTTTVRRRSPKVSTSGLSNCIG